MRADPPPKKKEKDSQREYALKKNKFKKVPGVREDPPLKKKKEIKLKVPETTRSSRSRVGKSRSQMSRRVKK